MAPLAQSLGPVAAVGVELVNVAVPDVVTLVLTVKGLPALLPVKVMLVPVFCGVNSLNSG